MQLKDKSPIPVNKRRVSKNNNPSAFSHKNSDGAVQVSGQQIVQTHQSGTHLVERKDSEAAFILVNGKLETIQSQRN